jgi:hypothetical protein
VTGLFLYQRASRLSMSMLIMWVLDSTCPITLIRIYRVARLYSR